MCILFVYFAKRCLILLFECSIHVSDGFPIKKTFGWGGGVGGWVG